MCCSQHPNRRRQKIQTEALPQQARTLQEASSGVGLDMDSFLHRLITWTPAEIFMSLAGAVVAVAVISYADQVLRTLREIASSLERLERRADHSQNSN